MKRVRLLDQARDERRAEAAYYESTANSEVANRFVAALLEAQRLIGQQPGIGSPLLGESLGIPGLRTWRLTGFPVRLATLRAALGRDT